jgi:hypothetical protein
MPLEMFILHEVLIYPFSYSDTSYDEDSLLFPLLLLRPVCSESQHTQVQEAARENY